MHFLLRSYVHFWNQYEKTDFFIPHLTYSKKKSFHLIEVTLDLFENLKGQKWKKPLNILENGFLWTDLRFSLPFQNFMPDIEIMKFCQNHWFLMEIFHGPLKMHRFHCWIWQKRNADLSHQDLFFRTFCSRNLNLHRRTFCRDKRSGDKRAGDERSVDERSESWIMHRYFSS